MTSIIPHCACDTQVKYGLVCIELIPNRISEHLKNKRRPATLLWVCDYTLESIQKAITYSREIGKWQPIKGESVDLKEGTRLLGLKIRIRNMLNPGISGFEVC